MKEICIIKVSKLKIDEQAHSIEQEECSFLIPAKDMPEINEILKKIKEKHEAAK